MATFPATNSVRYKPLVGYAPRLEEYVLRSESEDGKSQRRDRWGRLRFAAEPTYELPESDAAALYAEYEALRLTTFYYFDQVKRRLFGQAIGTGDGATTTFTLPAREIDAGSLVVYVDEVPTVAYTLSRGTGGDDEDRVVLNAAPAAGLAVTADVTGRIRYTCEFAGAPGERVGFRDGYVRLTFPIREAW